MKCTPVDDASCVANGGKTGCLHCANFKKITALGCCDLSTYASQDKMGVNYTCVGDSAPGVANGVYASLYPCPVDGRLPSAADYCKRTGMTV